MGLRKPNKGVFWIKEDPESEYKKLGKGRVVSFVKAFTIWVRDIYYAWNFRN